MTASHRWRAFALLAVAFFTTIADLAIVNVALPTIGQKLHFSELNLQWVVTAPTALTGGFQWAFWVCGAAALLGVPVAFLLVRTDELAQAVEAATASDSALAASAA